MKKIFLSVLAGLMSIVGLAGFGANNVNAMSMAVSPMKQSIMLVPGETYEGSITISNPSDAKEDLNYSVTINPYTIKSGDGSDDYNNFDIEEMTALNEVVNWTTLKNNKGTLEPNESAKVRFIINVPKDAPAGGQYAALVVSMGDKVENSEKDSVAIGEKWQMTSKIYAEVVGETIQKGAILDNTVPAFLLNNTLTTTSMVENQGNVHTDAKYTLQVWPFGSDEEICTNEEDIDTDIVLPNTKKFYQQTCNLPSVGIYKAKQVVEIFGEKSEVEKMIVYCPIWMMLVILFGIAMIIIWLVMSARGRKKTTRKA